MEVTLVQVWSPIASGRTKAQSISLLVFMGRRCLGHSETMRKGPRQEALTSVGNPLLIVSTKRHRKEKNQTVSLTHSLPLPNPTQ